MSEGPLLYVASRASLPERPAMWRSLRDQGWRIVSTWIDEAGEGQTLDYADLWTRIESEIRACDGLILYAEPDDFPLKGAMVEVGMALAMGKPVAAVLPDCSYIDARTMRPVGSWLCHPRCVIFGNLGMARWWIPQAMKLKPAPAEPDRARRIYSPSEGEARAELETIGVAEAHIDSQDAGESSGVFRFNPEGRFIDWPVPIEKAPAPVKVPVTRYRHVPTGKIFEWIATAKMVATGETVVVYRDIYPAQVWVRPLAEFLDGRFEPIDAGDC